MRFSAGAVHRRTDEVPQVGQARRDSAAPIGSAAIHGPQVSHLYS
jgi:hypothetical protein